MSAKNTTNSFGSVAKSFHWTIAFLIIAMLVLGYFLEDFPASVGEMPYNTHKTIGIIILVLVLLRLGWRWFNIQPSYSATLPPAYKMFVRVAHYAIYLVIIAMPISGWVMSTAAGHVPMPGISLNENLANQMFQLHNFLAIVLIVLVSFHVLAVLIHHFILKDNVLKRMLPGKNNKE